MRYSLSILSYANELYDKKEIVQKILAKGISYLHIDIMRENFVGRTAFLEEDIREVCTWHNQLDIHVMAKEPKEILNCIEGCISGYARESTFITLPLEAFSNGNYIHYEKICSELQYLRRAGFNPGVALEPETSVAHLQPLLGSIDMILLMAVKSGAGGQKLNTGVLPKAEAVRSYGKTIAVDGGINPDTLPLVKSAGIDIAVVGSCITAAKDPVHAASIYFKA